MGKGRLRRPSGPDKRPSRVQSSRLRLHARLVHLLIDPDIEVADLRRILSAFKARTSTLILARFRGQRIAPPRLWQPGSGYDRIIHSNKEFYEKLDYIESNTVRKGLVVRIEDYAWSSAGSKILGRDVW